MNPDFVITFDQPIPMEDLNGVTIHFPRPWTLATQRQAALMELLEARNAEIDTLKRSLEDHQHILRRTRVTKITNTTEHYCFTIDRSVDAETRVYGDDVDLLYRLIAEAKDPTKAV